MRPSLIPHKLAAAESLKRPKTDRDKSRESQKPRLGPGRQVDHAARGAWMALPQGLGCGAETPGSESPIIAVTINVITVPMRILVRRRKEE